MFKLRRKYIDPNHQKKFIGFQYRGGTDSITYQYIWGPLAQYLLQYFPLWMAPNLITLSSLILMTICHLLFMFSGSNQNGVPTWKLFMMAISIFIYQNLDNIDGKQARRIRAGSPLGMLFDHGTDSLCSFLLALQFLEIIRINNFNVTILVLFVFIMLPFFSALWVQYSTGVFTLGRVNPVDEGLPSLALTAIFFAIYYPTTIADFHVFAPLNEQILLCLGVLLIALLVSMNKDIVKNATRQKYDVIQALSLPFITGATLIIGYIYKNQTNFTANGLQISYSLLFFWSRNMVQIQLYYIAGQKFKVYNRGTNIFIFTFLGYLFYGNYLQSIGITSSIYFWITTLINAIIYFQFVSNVLKQGSQILDINIFSIKQKRS